MAAPDAEAVAELISKIDHTHGCVEDLKRLADENAQVLQDMKDILASFRVVGATAKWIGGIAGAATAMWALLKGFRP